MQGATEIRTGGLRAAARKLSGPLLFVVLPLAVIELEKNVHGTSPASAKTGYGIPAEATPAILPKKIVKMIIMKSGWRMAHAAPSAVCL